MSVLVTTELRFPIADSESTLQNCTDREEDFGGIDENKHLLDRKQSMNQQQTKKSSS